MGRQMTLESIVFETIKLCDRYAEKASETALTEYEMLLYEQSCNMVQKYHKMQELMLEKIIKESELELNDYESERYQTPAE